MSESGDFTPAPHWAGHDFASARNMYDDHVRTSYADAVVNKVEATDLVPDKLVCQCENPLVIVCDVTGSMGTWPATIFSKLPYLEHEGKEYLGDDMQISFAAVGDAFSDQYALQVQPFVNGVELKNSLEKLIIEGGGGGTGEESYDLAALYYAKNAEFPNAIRKPILIFIGDEGIYSFIAEDKAKRFAKVEFAARDYAKAKAMVDEDKRHSGHERITPEQIFQDLKAKYNVYLIRKSYGDVDNKPTGKEAAIHDQWVKMLGVDHVVSMPEPERVVDVIFGLLAKESDRIGYFEEELKDRQLKDVDGDKKVSIVMKSLKTVHTSPASIKKIAGPHSSGKSIMAEESVGRTKSISLLDD